MGTERHRSLRERRIADGLCCRCGEPRGKYGTGTMCRPCADWKAKNMLGRRPSWKVVVLKCENCFAEFKRPKSGQGVFCPECLPWFNEKFDTLKAVQDMKGPSPAARLVEDMLKDGCANG